MGKTLKLALHLFALLFLAFSCTPERRIAVKFLKQSDEIPVLIIEPDYVFATNHKAQYLIENWEDKPKPEQDSLEISSSKFLKNLNQEVLLLEFNKKLLETLTKYPNIHIYKSSQMDEFLQKGSKGYIFNFNQLQIEEYLSLFRDSTYYNNRKYIQEFDKESVTANFWIEITETNNPQSLMRVGFTSVHTYDKISGYFSYDLFTGEVKYVYNFDELKLPKIYGMIDYAATKNGRLIYDYILNEKIKEKVIQKPNNEIRFHYDEIKNKLVRVYNDAYKYHFLNK